MAHSGFNLSDLIRPRGFFASIARSDCGPVPHGYACARRPFRTPRSIS